MMHVQGMAAICAGAMLGSTTWECCTAGQRALAAVARAVDGRGPPTELVATACRHCQVESPQDLLGCVIFPQYASHCLELM